MQKTYQVLSQYTLVIISSIIIFIVLSSPLSNVYSQEQTEYSFNAKWGSTGSSNSQFEEPSDLALDPSSNNVIIPDSGNDRIELFTKNGSFITEWTSFIGSDNTNKEKYSHPHGIAIDSKTGNLYVVDRDLAIVLKFDSDGNFITKWGSKGTADGQFLQPEGISVDMLGKTVIVSDTRTNTISKFIME